MVHEKRKRETGSCQVGGGCSTNSTVICGPMYVKVEAAATDVIQWKRVRGKQGQLGCSRSKCCCSGAANSWKQDAMALDAVMEAV